MAIWSEQSSLWYKIGFEKNIWKRCDDVTDIKVYEFIKIQKSNYFEKKTFLS